MINEKITKLLISQLTTATEKFDSLTPWTTGSANMNNIVMSNDVSDDSKILSGMAKLDFPDLVVRSAAQPLKVTGITNPDGQKVDNAWKFWNRVGFSHMEQPVYMDALRYGESYMLLEKTVGGKTKGKPFSATRAQGFFENPFDKYPAYGVLINRLASDENVIWEDEKNKYDEYFIYDETWKYTVRRGKGVNSFGGEVVDYPIVSAVKHGFFNVPLVRFSPQINIDGTTIGDVEKHISLFETINMRAYNANLNLHFQSYMIRTATGIDIPQKIVDEDGTVLFDPEKQLERMLGQGTMLVDGNPDAKFGSLPYTPFEGFEAALDQAIRILASNAQITPGLLLGEIQGTSAEMANVVSQSNRMKEETLQSIFGESWISLIRLEENDEELDVILSWKDVENKSIAAIVDALGKQAANLEAPKTELWKDIPNMTPVKYTAWLNKYEAEKAEIQAQMDALTGVNSNTAGPDDTDNYIQKQLDAEIGL